MIQQTDARTNTLKFFYTDPLGRLTTKLIYNSANALVGSVTNIYDASDDPGYTVFPGQLYKVVDLQGYQRSSYDVRGRVLKSGRFLKANSMEYVTQATYDDADRVQTLTYPGNAATIQYTYDTGDNLSQVKSTAGTGTNEIFYTPQGFNALGQLTGYTNGNGVITAYAYYANSKRLTNFTTSFHGTNYQNLNYTYDKVYDVASINDGVYSGSASASISNVAYDDFYRITSISSTARGTKTYGYNAIGNILTNQDFGSGSYTYGAKPHAVTSANGVSYGYDACGNMTTRGAQTLSYDSENQLALVTSTNDSVAFGYDDSGERLWRAGTNNYTVWIGGIYEINNGKVLCHVLAGGQLIATFEPQCNAGLSQVFGEQNWFIASNKIESVLNWPFQQGRASWTFFAGMWAAILGVGLAAGRRISLKRYELRKALRPTSLWRSAVTVTIISAFLWASVGNAEAAPIYSPIFYYYHTDHLDSTNVMTDRSGNVVQHYEYATFGQTSYQNNTSAFPLSNRYTGQTDDDETGLYYYGARYYDPQLGRFIQPDTNVQSPDNPQTLNRYAYCGNNPLNYTDPSGNFSFVTGLIGAAVGAIVGGVWAAVTHHSILRGVLGGALAGFLVGCGISAGGADFASFAGISSAEGAAAGGAVGGAAGGAADASINGGNILESALIGGFAGAIAGSLDPYTTDGQYYSNDFTMAAHAPLSDPSFLDDVSNSLSNIELTPGQASALGGAATAASTASTNGSISAPNTVVSFIPVIGSAWESVHDFSTGHWIMGTAYAAMAVLDVTGVGEVGDLALKGALKIAETHAVYEGVGEAGRYIGITSRSPGVRWGEHRAAIGSGRESLNYQVVPGAENLTKLQARIWEQKLINANGGIRGGRLLNQRNSISPKYWQQHGIPPP
jgi:RHS repeat-associated protein